MDSGPTDNIHLPTVEGNGSLVLRGSMDIEDVEELLGIHFGENSDETVMTIAGLLGHVSGKGAVAPGDKVDLEGYRFELLEANQRKVLRLRARHLKATAQTARR